MENIITILYLLTIVNTLLYTNIFSEDPLLNTLVIIIKSFCNKEASPANSSPAVSSWRT